MKMDWRWCVNMSLEEKIALMQSIGQFTEAWESEEDSAQEFVINSGAIAFLMSFRSLLS